MDNEQYFKNLKKDVDKVYFLAEEARKKNLDPKNKVEIPLAMSMAEKVVGLISTIYPQMMGSGIAERILDLEKVYGKLDTTIVFKIAEEVAKQNFCKFDSLLQAMEAGIRVGFAYSTLGVVSSPIEGFTDLKINKTREGKEYLVAYFSGPIRSAGTTASCVVLMLIDYLRELFGFAKYDPSEEEIKRYVTENTDYHERITNLQYFPTEEEMLFLARNLPIQISGEPTEKLEVSNYRNLERVEVNYIRGGMCLIFSEGLAQKAAKGLRLLDGAKRNGINSTGWDFLKDYVELHKKRDLGKTDSSPTYIKDLVAGRPVFGHPSRSGAFRFRYGRGRTSGFSAASLHPATMAVTDDFIAIGTQLKIEKPTKGCAITSVDTIDGPIVKLFNGTVRQLKTVEETRKVYSDIEEIIYLGDILFPLSDLANRNHVLIKPGYVEEWWHLDLKEKDEELCNIINPFSISLEEATGISLKYGIPLNPKFIFYWNEISRDQFLNLIKWFSYSKVSGKIILPFNKSEQEKFKEGKRALELLGVEHDISLEHVIVGEDASKNLFANLGLDFNLISSKVDFFLSEIFDKNLFENYFTENKFILEVVNSFSKFFIKDKSGDFIGTRMGRPEKAKLRKLTGSPNTLFPVGWEGGKLRSLNAACEKGFVKGDFPIYFCDKCNKETIYPSCENCGLPTKKQYYFYELGRKAFEKKILECEKDGSGYCSQNLDINHYLQTALKSLNMKKEELPPLIKGIRGTSSDSHSTEHLEKGILRAKYDLQVNKDGTIRFDATELPIVSFKPKEVGVSVEKLRELGYDLDIYGKDLVDENQLLDLMPHDILLPSCVDTPNERADDVFIKVCNFIDELLVKFYKLDPFYNIKKKEDLIGQLGVCMAPHNCAGVVCRFIGFSNTLGLFASPFMHAAVRRDCDGDEAAIMLLGDVLLNFSRDFLPGHRGGTQDAPLVLNAKIDAGEVDEQILDFEFVPEGHYPLEMYRMAEAREHSSKLKIYNIKQILKEGKNPFVGSGFTHDTSNFNDGVLCSNYKTLATMQDKLKHQMELVEKIRAVNERDVARLVIERHFISDMRGNLRKFSMQGFRCVGCNEIMRRPPLSGVCPKCKGKIIFTIHEGGIRKYLDSALDLIKKYNLSPYIKQSVELTKEAIDSIFGKEIEKQEALQKWL